MSDKMLLHACCGPCSIYPSHHLREIEQAFALYFFNPNIHPHREFKKRLLTLREFCELEKLELIVDKSYPLEDFLRNALAEPKSRCYYCYKVRMLKTAEYAKEQGFTSFASTLLGSPYQQHEEIKKLAQEASDIFDIEFRYFDFRQGFAWGTQVSKDREMYRQGYCGCIFSERDRYEKKKK